MTEYKIAEAASEGILRDYINRIEGNLNNILISKNFLEKSINSLKVTQEFEEIVGKTNTPKIYDDSITSKLIELNDFSYEISIELAKLTETLNQICK